MKPRLKVRNGRIMPSELPIHQPNPTLVANLKDLLEGAREGEIIAFAGVYQRPDGDMDSVWTAFGENVQRYRMTGHLFSLMNELTFDETAVADRLMWAD